MDATAELQHVIREARHDTWGVYELARQNALTIIRLSDVDDIAVRSKAVIGAIRAAQAWCLVQIKEETVKVVCLRMVAADPTWAKYRSEPTSVPLRLLDGIQELIDLSGIGLPENECVEIERIPFSLDNEGSTV